jgi:starch synthase
MRILMVASEVWPFAKTGGLADVLGALPRALAKRGHTVDVVLPRYRGVDTGEPMGAVPVFMGGTRRDAPLFSMQMDPGVRVISVAQDDYYAREHLYGPPAGAYPDNAERFGFLAHATLAMAARQPAPYDIVHAHDWQCGLVPALLETTYAALNGVGRTPTVFTIHNLAYQGLFDLACLPRLGLGPDMARVETMEYWGQVSFLKAGIQFASILTTVSPRYAMEIQSPELGFGLDGVLRYRARDLVGILNGIDYDQWNPATDVHLPTSFDASNLAGKDAAKQRLLEDLGLPVTAQTRVRPLVGLISRLVEQKGFDLLGSVSGQLLALEATFVLLGSGEAVYEESWRALAAEHPERVGVRIGFDEGLAHLIEAGADIFLMPSRFEPCGLNQMYSLRYGTVPVVRDVGGLHDTVRDYDEASGHGTGFTFAEYSGEALLDALNRALAAYQDRDAWSRIQQAGMREDHSWETSARAYEAVYERAGRATG